ncbi:hypothetical protein [Bartonella sp. 1-1C]|uniref:hypothetical protein n=1 Tax=Bartonella sp. 1-1C TaxID=515256 RepID=UPI001FD9D6AF|nr:hypothetical protein [Bartonella sp. 1-1C]
MYLAESDAADHAGDDETAWEWLSMADLPAHTLLFLKSQNGAQFIRDMEFSTKSADKEYGADWLDKDIMVGGHYF